MNNAEPTLGRIALDAAMKATQDGKGTTDYWNIIASAVESAVLARQQPASGELSEAAVRAIVERFWFVTGRRTGEECKTAIVSEVCALRPSAPTVYRTSEKAPTEADENGHLLFGFSTTCNEYVCRSSASMIMSDTPDPAWFAVKLPPPPAPEVSAEEKARLAAFDAKMAAVQRLRLKHGVISDALPEMWDEAIAFATTQQPQEPTR